MKRALVTGHIGFAGRHYAAALRKADYEVFGVDTAESHGMQQDARNFFRFNFQGYFDLVVHCAAIVGGRSVIDGRPLALASNLELDAALFQWALRMKPGRIVYVSSSAAYPVHLQQLHDRRKLAESDIDPHGAGAYQGTPDALYGWAKLTGEKLAVRAQAEGLGVTIIRPFSGYGEDQAEDYPFRAFIERAKRREDPFTIWGNPMQVRDFIHIDDIVAATLVLAEKGIDEPVNLGTGRGVSMAQFARMVTAAAGYSPAIHSDRDKPMGVAYRVSDTTVMREFYTPKISLEEGIKRALAS